MPNDIAALLAKAPIEAVFCNGATAYRIYTKYLQPVSGIAAVKAAQHQPGKRRLPPGNAARGLGRSAGPVDFQMIARL